MLTQYNRKNMGLLKSDELRRTPEMVYNRKKWVY